MAVLTAKGISAVAIELLTRSLVLPMTVSKASGAEFAGSNGDTITVRVPQPRSSRTQATPSADITYDGANEVAVDVQMSHIYNGHLLSDEESSLEIENFATQITAPQVASVATGAEDLLAAAMDALGADLSLDFTAAAANTRATILAAREALTQADVPSGDRWLAASPEIVTRLLSVEDFVQVDKSGADSALRNAVVGKIFGLNVIETNAIAAETALAYHKSGFVMANRVPVAPRGANESATAASGGIGLRQIFDYVPTKLSDASVVSTFFGASAVAETDSADSLDDFVRSVKIDVGTV